MSTEPLDPAAIMAEHHSMTYGKREHCIKCGPAFDWPCLPYRLAAENAALREQVTALTEPETGGWDGSCPFCGGEGHICPG